MASKTRRGQTIPDDVLRRMIEDYPHLAAAAANLKKMPLYAQSIERHLATNYLLGAGRSLSVAEIYALASCANGESYGTHGGNHGNR